MEDKPRISIIVPAYNVEKYIEQCLRSIMEQTYQNLEIIVVNDGSKDKTGEIVSRLAEEDKRIKVITQENQGLSETRNNAMQVVTSEFIMFVDGDDWIEHDTCEKAMAEFENKDVDIVWFAYIREYENNSIKKGAFDEKRIVFEGEEGKKRLQRRIYGPFEEELAHPEKLDALSPVWGKIYKTNIIKNHLFKSFKEIGATCEDVFFNTEVLGEVQKVIYINENLYHYRKFNPLSLTKGVDKDLFDKWKRAYSLLSKIIDENNYDETYKQALKNRFAVNLIAIGLRIKNCNNPFREKYRMINDILHDEIYIDAIKNLNIKYMPLHWKTFFWNAKKKCTFMVYVLLIFMSHLASKK